MERLLSIIYESADLLVIDKQADLVCHPTKGDSYSSLVSRLRLYLGSEVGIHMINRLDRETSGVVLVAKNRQAAFELRRLWETRQVFKRYQAIVHGWPQDDYLLISAALGKDEASILSFKDCVRPDGVAARTEFSVEKRFTQNEREFSLLRVLPSTGRKHQIRIHLSHCGHPIVGDKVYGVNEDVYLNFVRGQLTCAQRLDLILPCHALHAEEVHFSWRKQEFAFRSEPEKWFSQFYLSFH